MIFFTLNQFIYNWLKKKLLIIHILFIAIEMLFFKDKNEMFIRFGDDIYFEFLNHREKLWNHAL